VRLTLHHSRDALVVGETCSFISWMVDGILMFRRSWSGVPCRGVGCRGVRRLGGLLDARCKSSQSSLRLRIEARELRPGNKGELSKHVILDVWCLFLKYIDFSPTLLQMWKILLNSPHFIDLMGLIYLGILFHNSNNTYQCMFISLL